MFSLRHTDKKNMLKLLGCASNLPRDTYLYANKKRENVLNNTLHQYLILIILITAMNYSFLYENPNNLRSSPI